MGQYHLCPLVVLVLHLFLGETFEITSHSEISAYPLKTRRSLHTEVKRDISASSLKDSSYSASTGNVKETEEKQSKGLLGSILGGGGNCGGLGGLTSGLTGGLLGSGVGGGGGGGGNEGGGGLGGLTAGLTGGAGGGLLGSGAGVGALVSNLLGGILVKSQCVTCDNAASESKSLMSDSVDAGDSESGSFRKSEGLDKASDGSASEDENTLVDAGANVLSINENQLLQKASNQGLNSEDERNIASSKSSLKKNLVPCEGDAEANVDNLNRVRTKRQLGDDGSLVDANLDSDRQSGGSKSEDDSSTRTEKERAMLVRSSEERSIDNVEGKKLRSEPNFKATHRELMIDEKIKSFEESSPEDETVKIVKLKKLMEETKSKKFETVMDKTKPTFNDNDGDESNYRGRSEGIKEDKSTVGVREGGKRSQPSRSSEIDNIDDIETSKENSEDKRRKKIKSEEITESRHIMSEYSKRKEEHNINSNEASKNEGRRAKDYVQKVQTNKNVSIRRIIPLNSVGTSEENSKHMKSRELDKTYSLGTDVKIIESLKRKDVDQEVGKDIVQKNCENEESQDIESTDGNETGNEYGKNVESKGIGYETYVKSSENASNINFDNTDEEETGDKSDTHKGVRELNYMHGIKTLRESRFNIESKEINFIDLAETVKDSSKTEESKETDTLAVRTDGKSSENKSGKDVSYLSREETKKEKANNFEKSSANEENKEIDRIGKTVEDSSKDVENDEKGISVGSNIKSSEIIGNKEVDPSDVQTHEENSEDKGSKEMEKNYNLKSGVHIDSKNMDMNNRNKEETKGKNYENEETGKVSYLNRVKTDEESIGSVENKELGLSSTDETGVDGVSEESKKVDEIDGLQFGSVKSGDINNKDVHYLSGEKTGEKSCPGNGELINIDSKKTDNKGSENGKTNDLDSLSTVLSVEERSKKLKSKEINQIYSVDTDKRSSQKAVSMDMDLTDEVKVHTKNNKLKPLESNGKRSCNEDSCEFDDVEYGGMDVKNLDSKKGKNDKSSENDSIMELENKIRTLLYETYDHNINNKQIDHEDGYSGRKSSFGASYKSGIKESKNIGSKTVNRQTMTNLESGYNRRENERDLKMGSEEKADFEERNLENEDPVRKNIASATKDANDTFESMEVSSTDFIKKKSSINSGNKVEDMSESFTLTDKSNDSLEERDSVGHVATKYSSVYVDKNSEEASVDESDEVLKNTHSFREYEDSNSVINGFKSSEDSYFHSKSIEDFTHTEEDSFNEEHPDYEDYSYFELDLKSENPEPIDSQEENADDLNYEEIESTDTVENTRKGRRHKQYFPFPYSRRHSFEDMSKVTMPRMHWPFMNRSHCRPFYSRKRHSNARFKRSIPPAEARQFEMPIMQRSPFAIASSNLFGSHAIAESSPFLSGGELGLGGEEGEEEGELGKK